jgi:hypothetical protein
MGKTYPHQYGSYHHTCGGISPEKSIVISNFDKFSNFLNFPVHIFLNSITWQINIPYNFINFHLLTFDLSFISLGNRLPCWLIIYTITI